MTQRRLASVLGTPQQYVNFQTNSESMGKCLHMMLRRRVRAYSRTGCRSTQRRC